MATAQATPLLAIADTTAELLIYSGCVASFGDDKVEALADTLAAFLKTAGIPVDEAAAAAHDADVRDRDREFEAVANANPFIDDGQL